MLMKVNTCIAKTDRELKSKNKIHAQRHQESATNYDCQRRNLNRTAKQIKQKRQESIRTKLN